MLWTFPTTCSLLSFEGKTERQRTEENERHATHTSLLSALHLLPNIQWEGEMHYTHPHLQLNVSFPEFLSLKSIKHVQLMWMCVRALFPVNKLVKWEERREIEATCVYVTQDFSLRLHCLSGVYHIPHCRGVQCVTCCLPITSVIPRYRGWGEIHFLHQLTSLLWQADIYTSSWMKNMVFRRGGRDIKTRVHLRVIHSQ